MEISYLLMLTFLYKLDTKFITIKLHRNVAFVCFKLVRHFKIKYSAYPVPNNDNSSHVTSDGTNLQNNSLVMSLSSCIFCNICSGAQPTDLLYEDEEIVVFKDIKPAAKHHYLAVPKSHIRDVKSLSADHKVILGKLIEVGKRVLQENGGNVDDLRIGFHVPPFNSISHLHLHLIAPASEMSFLSRMIFKPNTWWFATADAIMEKLPNQNKL